MSIAPRSSRSRKGRVRASNTQRNSPSSSRQPAGISLEPRRLFIQHHRIRARCSAAGRHRSLARRDHSRPQGLIMIQSLALSKPSEGVRPTPSTAVPRTGDLPNPSFRRRSQSSAAIEGAAAPRKKARMLPEDLARSGVSGNSRGRGRPFSADGTTSALPQTSVLDDALGMQSPSTAPAASLRPKPRSPEAPPTTEISTPQDFDYRPHLGSGFSANSSAAPLPGKGATQFNPITSSQWGPPASPSLGRLRLRFRGGGWIRRAMCFCPMWGRFADGRAEQGPSESCRCRLAQGLSCQRL